MLFNTLYKFFLILSRIVTTSEGRRVCIIRVCSVKKEDFAQLTVAYSKWRSRRSRRPCCMGSSRRGRSSEGSTSGSPGRRSAHRDRPGSTRSRPAASPSASPSARRAPPSPSSAPGSQCSRSRSSASASGGNAGAPRRTRCLADCIQSDQLISDHILYK